MNRKEAYIARVEVGNRVLGEAWRLGKLSIEVIGPAMVLTRQDFRIAKRLSDNRKGAMSADD